MLRLEGLSCGYGPVRAVHDLSVEVPAGSVLALLGPNGAGKTSTIRAVMGDATIHAGRILFKQGHHHGAARHARAARDRAGPGGTPAFL